MRTCLAWGAPLLLAAACAHKPPNPEPVPATVAPATLPAPVAVAPSPPPERSCSNDAECSARELCVQSRCVRITPELAECRNAQVHFPFDRADLEPQELPVLQRLSRCLTAEQELRLVVEGNADERGTVEYNLSLGDRRANAVQKYLRDLGASPGQLKTVSYGKEKPLCREHSETCWARNRRAAVEPPP